MSKILSLLSGQFSHLNLCHGSTWGDRNRAAIAVLQVNITCSSEEGRGGQERNSGRAKAKWSGYGALRALGPEMPSFCLVTSTCQHPVLVVGSDMLLSTAGSQQRSGLCCSVCLSWVLLFEAIGKPFSPAGGLGMDASCSSARHHKYTPPCSSLII